MRRRLDIAASLVVTPELLFLDEPTTGLDPRSRNQVWDIVRAIAAEGTTVLLTTQYLEEADRLADRLAVIDHGRLIAEGTSRELKASVGGSTLHVRSRPGAPSRRPSAAEGRCSAGGAQRRWTRIRCRRGGRTSACRDALAALAAPGMAVAEFAMGQPSLDEVFFALTGHAGRGEPPQAEAPTA
jgi:ABC-2 type transport system ATP-binding protein